MFGGITIKLMGHPAYNTLNVQCTCNPTSFLLSISSLIIKNMLHKHNNALKKVIMHRVDRLGGHISVIHCLQLVNS